MVSKNSKSIKYEEKGISWETFPEICKSCGLCIEKCPQKCLLFDGEGIDYLGMPVVKCQVEKCIACRICELNCPDCAIVVRGKDGQ